MRALSPDDQALNAAFAAARVAAAQGEAPIGAAILHRGEVIVRTHNLVETTPDPTAHAEILAIRQAAALLGDARLPECDLVVTLEPCAMCAGAIEHARIRRLVFAAYDPKGGAVDHGARVFQRPACRHAPDIIGGIREAESRDMLQAFFKALR
jgi:tRNA(adenine34) deaminase